MAVHKTVVDRLLNQSATRSRLKTTLNGKKMRTTVFYDIMIQMTTASNTYSSLLKERAQRVIGSNRARMGSSCWSGSSGSLVRPCEEGSESTKGPSY
jgi:hypothetical protein